MRQVTQRHGINLGGIQPDGVWLTEDSDGALDVDSRQLMTGLTFPESETILTLKEESKSPDQN